MLHALFRKVEDLQFDLEELKIEKSDAEVSDCYCHTVTN